MKIQANEATKFNLLNSFSDYPFSENQRFEIYETVDGAEALPLQIEKTFSIKHIIHFLNSKNNVEVSFSSIRSTIERKDLSIDGTKSLIGQKVRSYEVFLKVGKLDGTTMNTNLFVLSKTIKYFFPKKWDQENKEWLPAEKTAENCWLLNSAIQISENFGSKADSEIDEISFTIANLEISYTPPNYLNKLIFRETAIAPISKFELDMPATSAIAVSRGVGVYRWNKNGISDIVPLKIVDNGRKNMLIKLRPIQSGVWIMDFFTFPDISRIPNPLQASKYKASTLDPAATGDTDPIADEGIFFNKRTGETFLKSDGTEPKGIRPELATHTPPRPRPNDNNSTNDNPAKESAGSQLPYSELNSFLLRGKFPNDINNQNGVTYVVIDDIVFEIKIQENFLNGLAYKSQPSWVATVNRMGVGSFQGLSSEITLPELPPAIEPIITLFDINRSTSGNIFQGLASQYFSRKNQIQNKIGNFFFELLPFGNVISAERDLDSNLHGRIDGKRIEDSLNIGTDSIIDKKRKEKGPKGLMGIHGKYFFLVQDWESTGDIQKVDGMPVTKEIGSLVNLVNAKWSMTRAVSQENVVQEFKFSLSQTVPSTGKLKIYIPNKPLSYHLIKGFDTFHCDPIAEERCNNNLDVRLLQKFDFSQEVFPITEIQLPITFPHNQTLMDNGVGKKIDIEILTSEIIIKISKPLHKKECTFGVNCDNDLQTLSIEAQNKTITDGEINVDWIAVGTPITSLSNLAKSYELLSQGFNWDILSKWLNQTTLEESYIESGTNIKKWRQVENTTKFRRKLFSFELDYPVLINSIPLSTIFTKEVFNINFFSEKGDEILKLENLISANSIDGDFTKTEIHFIY